MDIRSSKAIRTKPVSPEYFTGTVWVEQLVETPPPARLSAAVFRFDPGARTHWHTHPLGQTFYVLSGVGIVQKEGEAARLIHPGDAVWVPPGEKHWHGAAPNHAMAHVAMHEALDGSFVTWAGLVTAAQYDDAAREALRG
jgi:quercetin dioxygenase-like cupin family protein